MKPIKLLTGALLAALLTGCSLLPEEETFEAAPVIKSYEAPAYAMTYVERQDMVKSVKISCTYVPVQTEKLSFLVSGEYIDELFVSAGDQVVRGQLLAQLQLGDIESQIEDCARQIDSLNLSLRHLEEDRELALRRSALTPGGDAEAVKESYDRQKQSLGDALYLQTCRMDELVTRRDQRQIRAGIDGTVTYARSFPEGARSVLGERVFTISDTTMSLFRAETDQWAQFRPGDAYTITVSKREYEATVADEASLGLTPQERTPGKKAFVYFTLTAPALDLEDNDRGMLTLVQDQRTEVLTLPESAVGTMNGHPVVYYLDEAGIKRYREIETGLTAEKRIEIISGLEEGDCVIAG